MERNYLHDCGSVTYFDDDELPVYHDRLTGNSVLFRCDGCDTAIVVPKAVKELLPPQHQ